ncbi:riboflavin synthase [Algicola sagamiensis]|uniref:riboflavin synthase n=1 Tax=Algicola sagamiensis TaxID=163869 RepID=UPI0003667E49|nr:riboflavin synthase [Algicola sagamiensis]
MFTGIIEAIGHIESIQMGADDARIRVRAGKMSMSDVKLGDSIATNGVCLTVVEMDAHHFTADVSNETLRLTNFGIYKAGQKVNLEKALMPTSRLGGHIVSGHVDGVAKVSAINKLSRAIDYWLELPKELVRYVAYKGSITVDGTSLTINAVEENRVKLTLVPHSLEETMISDYQVGTSVHIEVDVLARYLERLLLSTQKDENNPSGLTLESLTKAGFA